MAADELLYDLEHFIYHKGYGPTNETLGKYSRELFGQITQKIEAAGKATTSRGRTVRIAKVR